MRIECVLYAGLLLIAGCDDETANGSPGGNAGSGGGDPGGIWDASAPDPSTGPDASADLDPNAMPDAASEPDPSTLVDSGMPVAGSFDCLAMTELEGWTISRDNVLTIGGRTIRTSDTPSCQTNAGNMPLTFTWFWEDQAPDEIQYGSGYTDLMFLNSMQAVDLGTYTVIDQPQTNDEFNVRGVYGNFAIKPQPLVSALADAHLPTSGTIVIDELPSVEDSQATCRRFTFDNVVVVPEGGGASQTLNGVMACVRY